jgi:hypothetical protein
VNKYGAHTRCLALPENKKYPFPYSLEYYTYRKNISENIQLIRSRYSAASMILSERGIKKILTHFTTYDDILWPFDIEIHFVPEIRQYGIIDPVATNANFCFNYFDTGKVGRLSNFYEISDAHVKHIEECLARFKNLSGENWKKLFSSSNAQE